MNFPIFVANFYNNVDQNTNTLHFNSHNPCGIYVLL